MTSTNQQEWWRENFDEVFANDPNASVFEIFVVQVVAEAERRERERLLPELHSLYKKFAAYPTTYHKELDIFLTSLRGELPPKAGE